MRKKFLFWLKSYKEYSPNRAEKIVEMIDAISDNLVKSDVLPKHVFMCESFVDFAKLRRKIVSKYSCNNQEKNAFNLFSDFLEILGMSNYPFPEDVTSLEEYCNSTKMVYSYKAVLVRGLLKYNWSASIQELCDYFVEYYSARINGGEVAEKNDSIFASQSFTRLEAEKLIINNPIKALKNAGVVILRDDNKVYISSEYSALSGDKDRIDKACRERLVAYYEKISDTIIIPREVEQSINVIQNSLNEINDNIDVTSCDLLIKSLRKELSNVYKQQKTEKNSSDKQTGINELTEKKKHIEESDDRKVGKLVREEMLQLSEDGFVFSEEEINLFMDKVWSKKTFNVNYPFFRLYNPELPKNDQRKDHNGEGRYWAQLFTFGNDQYFITSEWYVGDRPYFINWFNSRFSS